MIRSGVCNTCQTVVPAHWAGDWAMPWFIASRHHSAGVFGEECDPAELCLHDKCGGTGDSVVIIRSKGGE